MVALSVMQFSFLGRSEVINDMMETDLPYSLIALQVFLVIVINPNTEQYILVLVLAKEQVVAFQMLQ